MDDLIARELVWRREHQVPLVSLPTFRPDDERRLLRRARKSSMACTMRGRMGRGLRTIRNARRLTQQKLAEISGVNVGTISRIERGIHPPTLSTVVHLARALETDPMELFKKRPKIAPYAGVGAHEYHGTDGPGGTPVQQSPLPMPALG